MAIVVNSSSESLGHTSAPKRSVELNVDLDDSYPTGGYDVTASLPQGATVVWSPKQPLDNGTAQTWNGHLVTTSGVTKLVVYVAATGAEVADEFDLALVTDQQVGALTE